MKRRICMMIIVVLTLLPLAAVAGNTDSPGDPTTSTAGHMPTLEELYQYLTSGTAPGAAEPFQEPTAGPGATMKTLQELYEDFKALIELCTVAPEQVLQGQTFFQTIGTWGPAAGTMPDNGAMTITPGPSDQTIAAGYHNGSGKVEGDANLVSGNIRSGGGVFGVAGDPNVVDTSSGDAAAGEILTGKTAWVDGSEITGTYTGSGPTCSGRLDGTRWCDNGDGTVTDMTTGLVWLKNACCFGRESWDDAGMYASSVKHGKCGLSDGSAQYDWRLPTRDELYGLTHGSEQIRSYTPGPFYRVLPRTAYWSSTSHASISNYVWRVNPLDGAESASKKTSSYSPVWPVRGGQ